ncbi:hypothetical protein A2J03_28615 [Rhodococcus sp. EPR-157]|uniref:hypothetical protein n=1 Tax=Rhodococcus sp. EPR-157 TaxID=1813677 RepID=UPI0007BC7660|nr:hypothetical protein [Rhodococcus sp. EPR-157]KZF02480.1 hypothetical protein A2J03_28615 [Rhodococcus sp. EPR-157]
MRTPHIHDEVSSWRAVRLPGVDGPNTVTCATEVGAITVALAAAVVSTLANRGVPGGSGCVVIACPERAPLLGPVLLACGIGSITSWNTRDTQDFSLRRVSSHNHILVDLRVPEDLDDEIEDAITAGPDVMSAATVSLAGLSDALRRQMIAQIDTPVLAACARAMVLQTTPGDVLPT